MNKPSISEDRSVDEIDLRIVFQKIGAFFRRLLRSIRNFYLFVLRRWPLFVLVTLTGVGAGYLYYTSKRPFYNSSMILAPASIRSEFIEEQVNHISDLVNDKNYETLAADLKIDLKTASQLKSLSYAEISGAVAKEDSVFIGEPFKVDVEVYDNKLFGVFEKSLTGYLETNPYFANSTNAKRAQLTKLIAKLQVDIVSIDSIKQAAVTPRGPVNGFVYGEPLDPTNLYKQSVELLERQAHLENQLKVLQTMQVVVGFTPLIHPSGPNLKLYLFTGAGIGFLLALLLAYRYEKHQKNRINKFPA